MTNGTAMKPLMEIKNLTTRFYTQDGVVNAVNGISYTLDPGEILGVVGESGCGKSYSGLLLARGIAGPDGQAIPAGPSGCQLGAYVHLDPSARWRGGVPRRNQVIHRPE